jgi:hypothetical protein
MPRVARFRITAIDELCRELLRAPVHVRRRQMGAAEQLVTQVKPSRTYPEDFVRYRITGYRPESAGPPAMLVGEALVGDLVALVQQLSHTLQLPPNHDDRSAIALAEVASRLGVSSKSLQRYRRRGLVCHYVTFTDGEKRLACFEDVLQRFIQQHRKQLADAAGFTRVDKSIEQQIISEATALRASRNLSLNAVAKELAETHARAHETVRSILRRHDRRARPPIFAEHGPLTQRDIRLVFRAIRWGVSPAVLSRRFTKTSATVHRVFNHRRGELLQSLDLPYITLPTMDREDAEAVILSAPAVTTGLSAMPMQLEAISVIEAAHQAPPPQENLEQSLIAAYNLLKRRAGRVIESLGDDPSATVLDGVETDLRWATLLKATLIELGMPAAIAAIEQTLHRSLVQQPSHEIRMLLGLAILVAAETVQRIDPARGQRMDHTCGYAMDRALAVRGVRPVSTRAASRHTPGSVTLNDPFGSLDPWQSWLRLRPDLRPYLKKLDVRLRTLVRLHFGFDGRRPRAVSDLAEQFQMTSTAVVRAVRKAQRQLRAAHRI